MFLYNCLDTISRVKLKIILKNATMLIHAYGMNTARDLSYWKVWVAMRKPARDPVHELSETKTYTLPATCCYP